MGKENQILLHILKHNPKNGEVYITWEGETFVGEIYQIEVKRSVNDLTRFTLEGFVRDG